MRQNDIKRQIDSVGRNLADSENAECLNNRPAGFYLVRSPDDAAGGRVEICYIIWATQKGDPPRHVIDADLPFWDPVMHAGSDPRESIARQLDLMRLAADRPIINLDR